MCDMPLNSIAYYSQKHYNLFMYIYTYICTICPDTAKHQSKPQGYIHDIALRSADIALRSADIALRSDIAPAIETDYKKTTLGLGFYKSDIALVL